MPAWSEDDYVKRAAEVAAHSVVSKKSVTDACEKVAKEEALNPEEIRTLVRLSNVAMFQALFKQKDAEGQPDRNVEFEVGDPEVVIQRLHQAAAEGPQTASIMNDKLSHEIPDLMAAKRRGFELDNSRPKVATDLEVTPGRIDMVVLNMRKLADEFESRRMSAGYRWEEKLAELNRVFNKAPGYGPSFPDFCRDALSEHGEKVAVELDCMRRDLKLKTLPVDEAERAKLAEFHVAEDSPALTLLKEAYDARMEYQACEEAAGWVAKNTPVIGK